MDILNNRELAIGAWIIIFMIFSIFSRSLRNGIFSILKSFTHKWIIISIIIMIFYITVLTIFFYSIGLWDYSMLKESVFWFLFTGFFLMLNNINKINSFNIISIFLSSIGLSSLIEYITNIYTFSLVIEFLTLPLLWFVIMMVSVASAKEETKKIGSFFNYFLVIYGLVLIYLSIKHILNMELHEQISLLDSFVYLSLITISFKVLIYFFAVFSRYQSLYQGIDFNIKDKDLNKYFKKECFKYSGCNISKIDHINACHSLYIKSKEDVEFVFNKDILPTGDEVLDKEFGPLK